jgi:type III pantothenate kinase
VVPELTSFWQKRLEEATGLPPLVVTNQIQLGMGISYPDPSSIGGDRLANAVGALTEYGSPVIVADFGTALTFDVIDPQNNYVGGAIAPGLNFMTDYLADRTALLPRITIRGKCPPIGTTTEGAMRLGAIMGYSGMVERVVRHLRSQPQASGASLCLTGGSAELIGEHLEVDFVLDPELTLKGLQRIYELNADTARQPKGGC